MRPEALRRKRNLAKKKEKKRNEETTAKAKSPGFMPEASSLEDQIDSQKAVEPTTKADDNKEIAKLRLHSDTETVDRSKLTLRELMGARVGHSWVSLDFPDKDLIPEDIHPRTQALAEHDMASFGFWPLINRAGAGELTERGQTFTDAGLTPQSGESANPEHRGFSKNPFKWVAGRVEEPDLSHAPTGTVEYSLTGKELKSMLNYVDEKRNSDYNLYKFNCTTFAVDAVKAAGKNAPGGDNFLGVCLPNALYKDMLTMQENGDENVTLAPLREGESHGQGHKKNRKAN